MAAVVRELRPVPAGNQRALRYLDGLARTGYYGRVELLFRDGAIVQVDDKRTWKPDELPEEPATA